MDIEESATLAAYLRATGRIPSGEDVRCTTLSGGVSCRTVLVERPSGEEWVIKQALARLRVPVEWRSDPERVHREALGMRWLRELAPDGAIPEFLFEDRAEHLVGMRAVPRPHRNWKTILLEGEVVPEHVAQFGTLLGTIHRNSSRRRSELPDEFGDRSFFESLRVEPYYRFSAQQRPEAGPFLSELIDEMCDLRLTLVHGDYSPKNILIHEGRLILVDHEVIHRGDPAFDLGFSLTHLLSKAHHLVHLRSRLTQATSIYWRAYRGALADVDWAAGLEARAVRHTLACLLARVVGRSRLEYLDEPARARQTAAVLGLLDRPPTSVEELTTAFLHRL